MPPTHGRAGGLALAAVLLAGAVVLAYLRPWQTPGSTPTVTWEMTEGTGDAAEESGT